jgi:hypothetical protein
MNRDTDEAVVMFYFLLIIPNISAAIFGPGRMEFNTFVLTNVSFDILHVSPVHTCVAGCRCERRNGRRPRRLSPRLVHRHTGGLAESRRSHYVPKAVFRARRFRFPAL